MQRHRALLLLVSIAALSFSDVPALADMIVDTAWVRRYDGPSSGTDEAHAVATDGFGNIYVTGVSDGFGTSYDYLTIKYYPNGDTAWVRRYNGPADGYDEARAVAVDDSCGVYVTGFSSGSGTSLDYATIKYCPNGDTAWVRRYNGLLSEGTDVAQAMAIDVSGNVLVTGAGMGNDTSCDYTTIKYNPNGNTAWITTYRFQEDSADQASAIAVDGSGNVYVTGSSSGSGTSQTSDYATIKYYPTGDTAWARRYNGPDGLDDLAECITVDTSGHVYVTGTSFGDTSCDYATIKYYPNGDTAWVRRHKAGWAEAITVDDFGNVLVTGSAGTIKYDANGDALWTRPGFQFDMAVDGSGNVYVTGTSDQFGVSYDYVTIRYYPKGDTAWIRSYDGPGNGYDKPDAIAVDGSNNVCVTGYSFGNGTSDDYTTIKYFQAPRGDANRDGSITVGDAVYLLNFLFKEGPAPDPFEVGDATCNGYVTLSDAIFLLNYLFKGGPPPDC